MSAEARAVFDGVRRSRNSEFVDNSRRAPAHDPATPKRTWDGPKTVMRAGVLDPEVEEMIHVAVSVARGCACCVHSHAAAARARA